ncbi:MAG TPA: biotin--[acetyl-CoA-carboxylase] ligase [Candidatus Limnocylindria bacterium]|nr:biotin--[acetyl-CoA-carboxylase] ligase [Candidatus Limnocylindria bacterium]
MPRLGLLAHPAVASVVARELGRALEYYERIDSTQTRARTLAAAGATRGLVVADEQLQGQGTHGRLWVAPAASSLLASWIYRPAPAAPALFAALSGVAVARALDALGCGGARLKWPNDVELEGMKVAGALAHGTSDGSGGVLVIGIGVNVRQRGGDLPVELRARATSLALQGHEVDRLALLGRLTAELDRLEQQDERERALVEWRERSTVLGRAVRVSIAGGAGFTGTAAAIDDDGALVVRTASGIERVVAGEVVLA